MNRELIKFFFDEASKAFAFLVNEHYFGAAQMDVDRKINFATVTFLGRNLAIECIIDEREGDVTCKIARVIDGRKTAYYSVDDKGTRVREALSSILKRRDVRGRLLTSVGGLDFREQIKITLADFARMLREYGQQILDDSSAALD